MQPFCIGILLFIPNQGATPASVQNTECSFHVRMENHDSLFWLY